jgi:hypothetical protein
MQQNDECDKLMQAKIKKITKITMQGENEDSTRYHEKTKK